MGQEAREQCVTDGQGGHNVTEKLQEGRKEAGSAISKEKYISRGDSDR